MSSSVIVTSWLKLSQCEHTHSLLQVFFSKQIIPRTIALNRCLIVNTLPLKKHFTFLKLFFIQLLLLSWTFLKNRQIKREDTFFTEQKKGCLCANYRNLTCKPSLKIICKNCVLCDHPRSFDES